MNPFRRADHAETERLLDSARATVATTSDQVRRATPPVGDVTSPQVRVPAPAEPVAGLLAAAAGPIRPGELVGEEAALAAFRAARENPAPSVPHRPRRRRLTTGAVAWIGAVAATATAGAAFAAVTTRDWAPDPVPPAPTSTSPTPDTGASTSGDPRRSPSPGTPSPGTPSQGPPSPGMPPPGTPPAHTPPEGQLHGLCRAWQAKKPEQREKALRTPAFKRLVTAAGSADQVEAYCQRLVPEPKPSESVKPKPSPPPTGHPAPR
ncbi:hypothetical protein [Micromonospora parathelypteridis]|uniref:Uncharacterized protein n=1 Tax=Micromonospora parathelypteridis TaxID=1839617 RepID=A0A840W6Q5_9ACTN|nr:hypothetical protein [Micromonospora parathelypteridis]MBB5481704.1 hypothetical protein [Micromonospora parathelypteridis]GGO28574.1 hypothetical protein GCM10011576_54330 [Micromonospora parathelypteridis]